ncbi:MAG: S4 domain-containing protein [Oscillospiraceae bacterium]
MEQRTIQTQESAERIDALLARSFPELTRSAAQRLLAQGAVTKDGAPVKKNYKTAPGDTFVVTLPDAAPSALVAQDLPLDVVYEDDDLIVVNKPRGMVVPCPRARGRTLVNALLAHCGDSLSASAGARPASCRIRRHDRLLVAAKNDCASCARRNWPTMRWPARMKAVVCGNCVRMRLVIASHPTDRKAWPTSKTPATRSRTGRSSPLQLMTHIRCELGDRPHAPDPRAHGAHRPPCSATGLASHKRREKAGRFLRARRCVYSSRTGELVTFTCPRFHRIFPGRAGAPRPAGRLIERSFPHAQIRS